MKKKQIQKVHIKYLTLGVNLAEEGGDRKTFSVTITTRSVYNSTFKTKRKYDGRNGGMEDVFD